MSKKKRILSKLTQTIEGILSDESLPPAGRHELAAKVSVRLGELDSETGTNDFREIRQELARFRRETAAEFNEATGRRPF